MGDIAKIFWSGRSQAVRLPKAYRFTDDEVQIYRREDGTVVLEPVGADQPVRDPSEGAAIAIERLRNAIGAGLASGTSEPWNSDEIKRAARVA